MPRAHISEIVKIHPPKLRLIRSADVRFLRGVWHKLHTLKPGKVVIDSADGREIGLVGAWLGNGAPADLTVDKAGMDKAPQGNLFRVDMGNKRMEPVESASAPGFYLKRGEA